MRPIVVTEINQKDKLDREYYSPTGRREYRNGTIEHSFKSWAVVTLVLFLIAMIAGMIGMCCYCPHLRGRNTDWWDFFY